MCVAMNNGRLNPRERCASTLYRNIEGWHGMDGSTLLKNLAKTAAAHKAQIRGLGEIS